jgi:hypothetical protein
MHTILAAQLAQLELGHLNVERLEPAANLEPPDADAVTQTLAAIFNQPVAGEQLTGICRRRVDTSSASYALVERSREFSLVPWRPELERAIGREIAGRIRSSGGISWTLGRERTGPQIGM